MPKNIKPSNNPPKDSLDREVDEMLERAKDKRFEPGIYNFCDRWCEKCPDTEKCFLYSNATKRKAQNLINGQDDESIEGVLAEVHHSFEVTGRLLERELAEQGLDVAQVLKEAEGRTEWDDNVDRRYNQVECLKLAKSYLKRIHEFLNNFYNDKQKYHSNLGLEIDYSDINEEIETINWYQAMLPTKIWRYLYEKESLAREEDSELKEMMARDLDKFYALVDKGINQSQSAWENLAKKRVELKSDSQCFIEMLEKIKNEFKKLKNNLF